MKRLAVLAVMLMLLGAGAALADGSYDLANYWMVTPGQWVILNDADGNSIKAVVSPSNGTYNLEMRTIESDGSETLSRRFDQTLTDSAIVFSGEYNSRHDSATWSPTVNLPRIMEIGQAYKYTTTEYFLIDSYPAYITYVLDSDGYEITTSAGTFSNCLKLIVTQIDYSSITTDVFFLAKGVGIVRYITTKMDEDGPTNVPSSASWDMSQYGTE